MTLLSRTQRNNLLVALRGTTFTNPFIRRAFGQSPDNIDVVYLSSTKLGKRLQKEIHKKKRPFLAVIRNEQQLVEDVFLVPFEHDGEKFTLPSKYNIQIQNLETSVCHI